jgi:hypothetical protein
MLLLITIGTMAPTSAQTAKIVGIGATACSQFIAEANEAPASQKDYLAWAQGFMSGILLGRPAGADENLDLTPSSLPLLEQLRYLRDYCGRHPVDRFSDAVVLLYKRLREQGTK